MIVSEKPVLLSKHFCIRETGCGEPELAKAIYAGGKLIEVEWLYDVGICEVFIGFFDVVTQGGACEDHHRYGL
jgi:hypothetical protein